MKRRPFLLIHSDVVLKELAHLENRVDTYIKQLELGLHARLGATGEPFDVRRLGELEADAPPDPRRDAICVPTPADNRAMTAPLRGRIQHLFSADGEVDEGRLALAMLKALGPERSPRRGAMGASAATPVG